MSSLNMDLVKQQGLSDDDIAALEDVHGQKRKLYNTPIEDVYPADYILGMRYLEFKAQRLWRFPEDADYHSWWLYDPKCSCGILDNKDRIGTGTRVYSDRCALHGGLNG